MPDEWGGLLREEAERFNRRSRRGAIALCTIVVALGYLWLLRLPGSPGGTLQVIGEYLK